MILSCASIFRDQWMSSPDALVRAARHYESAAQVLILHATMSCRQYIKVSKNEPPALGTWTTAESAARIDLAGGWTDTPPIT